ncbi:glycosyltransferase [Pseudanabaena sp. FACHB-1277]|uniref:Glycosyltransferase n=1 Tax=Pseudanabaena cinerea FACHB-1277 TaxID=2949581 RepID=A0A926UW39_9CYAN|nr:glycosyltransferase [Pseudanabaena cinerea]MBD2152250.1 glycosyltransferase [Pseudanabaena cinerea FACHB-1277]
MTHFGIIAPSTTGHLNAMLPIGQELQKRGHLVTFLGILDVQATVIAAGLSFRAIGEQEFPLGTNKKNFNELGKLKGLEALKYTIKFVKNEAVVMLQESPSYIRELNIQALLVDQVSSYGGTIADYLNIPFITICNAVVLNREPSVPPFNTSWAYAPSWVGILRNKLGYQLLNVATKSITETINEFRQQHNLPLHTHPNQRYSQLAQISQAPPEFEFPRQKLPPHLHFTGPYHSASSRQAISFPFDKLTGQPLVYASMGTLQNKLLNVFADIAEACADFDVQLVISLGGASKPEDLPPLKGNPLVVTYAPQLEILPRATMMITHAGMNTAMECLTNGVPMVAIPVANDQPGVAARIAWTGCGEAIPVKQLNVKDLKVAIQKVLTNPSYKENALRLQKAIAASGGVSRAADIIEQAIATGKPVLKTNDCLNRL